MFWYTFRRARFSSLACKKSWCKIQPFQKPTSNKPTQQEKQSYKSYDFWLSKSITLNDSANSTKNISKLSCLRQFKNIKDSDVQEKEKCLRNGKKKVVCTASIWNHSIVSHLVKRKRKVVYRMYCSSQLMDTDHQWNYLHTNHSLDILSKWKNKNMQVLPIKGWKRVISEKQEGV